MRIPLVVFTPKSLLRHPDVKSGVEEFTGGEFREVLDDNNMDKAKVRKVILTSGKVYYDLLKYRTDNNIKDVALLRLEQYYPLPEKEIKDAVNSYGKAKAVAWVQEEPENMGAWYFLKLRFGDRLLNRFPFAGVHRPPSASPATGSGSSHKLEQKYVIEKAFGDGNGSAESSPEAIAEAVERVAAAL